MRLIRAQHLLDHSGHQSLAGQVSKPTLAAHHFTDVSQKPYHSLLQVSCNFPGQRSDEVPRTATSFKLAVRKWSTRDFYLCIQVFGNLCANWAKRPFWCSKINIQKVIWRWSGGEKVIFKREPDTKIEVLTGIRLEATVRKRNSERKEKQQWTNIKHKLQELRQINDNRASKANSPRDCSAPAKTPKRPSLPPSPFDYRSTRQLIRLTARTCSKPAWKSRAYF